MSVLIAVILFGILTWAGGVFVDMAMTAYWNNAETGYLIVITLIIAALAWGIVFPIWIVPAV